MYLSKFQNSRFERIHGRNLEQIQIFGVVGCRWKRDWMCYVLFTLVMAISCTIWADARSQTRDQMLTALKLGKQIYVRTWFSPDQDVLTCIGTGRHNNQINFVRSWLVPAEAPMDAELAGKGRVVHGMGDDAAPWKFNSTYIGGNHGCSGVREITSLKHGLTVADIGSAWTDAVSNTFYVIKIIDADRVHILSENKGAPRELWQFIINVAGPVLRGPSERLLKIESVIGSQIWPTCRINKQEYLINGITPLVDGQVAVCGFLDIVEEYDIIRPDSLLASIIENPGVDPDYTASHLEEIISNRITYCLQPRGACTIRHYAKIHQEIDLGYMGFTQSSKLIKSPDGIRELYIPKTIPFVLNGISLDFKAIQDITPDTSILRPKFGPLDNNIENPLNPPDRFIQFLGVEENGRRARTFGYAMGYSMLEGVSRPEIRANIKLVFRMTESLKSYPVAILGGKLAAGSELECLAYRQYFDPTEYNNATCVYWHKQGDCYVLYADYHQSVTGDVIKLPKELIGLKVVVLEKTPTLTLESSSVISAEGLKLSVTDDYGFVVLKLKNGTVI